MTHRSLSVLWLVVLASCNGSDPAATSSWQERVGDTYFENRNTLGNLGTPVSQLLGTEPLTAGKDYVALHGSSGATRFVAVERLADGITRRLRVFEGTSAKVDLTLKTGQEPLYSPGATWTLIFDRTMKEDGSLEWTGEEPLRLYHVGGGGPIEIGRAGALRPAWVNEQGEVLVELGDGRYRRHDSTGAKVAEFSLEGAYPSTVAPGQPWSRYLYLPTQDLIVLEDRAGMADARGRRTNSGLRLFSSKDGKPVGSFPNGTQVAAGSASPDRWVVVEKPGVMSFYKAGQKTGQVTLPGVGELSSSPDGHWLALTHPRDRLWLIDADQSRVLWEHTSPTPWNRYLEDRTRISNSGRIYAARLEEIQHDYPRQLQVFTIDPGGKGLILMEKEYQDVSLPPIWLMGSSDDGDEVLLGALGEQVRHFKLDRPVTMPEAETPAPK